MPATATTRGLSSPEAQIPDDSVLDWPHLEDAEAPEGLALGWPDLEDAELADWAPADSGLPKAGAREVLKAGRWDRARGDGGGSLPEAWRTTCPRDLCSPGSPGTPGRLG